MASEMGSLIFSDDVIHDGSSRLNSEVYRNIQSSILQRTASNQTGMNLIMHQDKSSKHTASTIKDLSERF